VPLYLLYDYCKPANYPCNVIQAPSKGVLSLISANHSGSYRCIILEKLKKHGIKVDYGGKWNNNIGGACPGEYYEQPIIDLQKQYRIVLALENSVHDDYITEKILNPFRSGSLPIYYGSDKISEYFHKERFLTISKDNIEQTVYEIKRLLEDDTYWMSKVNNPIFKKTTEERINEIILQMRKIISKK
jgi:hypothetical protein